VDPAESIIRLFMEAGDLGGRVVVGNVVVKVVVVETPLGGAERLLKNPCCDLIDTVVAVEAFEGDLDMMKAEWDAV
jgi:hypothetical protein